MIHVKSNHYAEHLKFMPMTSQKAKRKKKNPCPLHKSVLYH